MQGKQNYENFEHSRSRHPFADALSAGFMMKSHLLRKLTPASNSGEFFPTERIRSRLAIIIKWICISDPRKEFADAVSRARGKREHREWVPIHVNDRGRTDLD